MSDFQSRLQSALSDEFLIERELGGGGMSRVFLATERALQRRVVVKVLPPELAAGVNVDRFRREIQLAAGLQHPHIVPLLAAGDDNGLLWFSMPYIDGESLRGALVRQGRLPVRDVVRILHDVVDALAYAHARGVVHRDIKPDNILTSGMHALVTDFGVAKALSAAIPLPGGTTTGMAIGTPAYMAPEQLAADPAADHRVDLYAVGLLAYELLTGRSPFSGSSPQATLAAQLTKTPEAPHLAFGEVPEALSAIIMHCLEKDAVRRPGSAGELLAELDALPPMSSGRSVAFRSPARRKRTIIALGASTALVAIALLAAQRTRAPARTTADAATARDANRRSGSEGSDGKLKVPPKGARGARGAAATRPETVVVYRDLPSTDGVEGTRVPLVISRMDSLAIAEAMRRRMASGPVAAPPAANAGGVQGASPGTPLGGAVTMSGQGEVAREAGTSAASARAWNGVGQPPAPGGQGHVFITRPGEAGRHFTMERDQLVAEVRRVFTDSMLKALVGMDSAFARIPMMRMPARPSPVSVMPLVAPNADGRERVVIADFSDASRRKDVTGTGRDLAQFLRSALATNRFEVMDAETTLKASRMTGDRMAIGWMLRADFVVSGAVRERNDSLVVTTLLTDVRAGRNSRHAETVVPMTEPRRAFELALGKVNGWLDGARARGPQQSPGPPGTD